MNTPACDKELHYSIFKSIDLQFVIAVLFPFLIWNRVFKLPTQVLLPTYTETCLFLVQILLHAV